MPSQFFGLTIASSGLSAYQAALNTTANNISNEQTKGYTWYPVVSNLCLAIVVRSPRLDVSPYVMPPSWNRADKRIPKRRCPKVGWWGVWSSDSICQARSTNYINRRIITNLADSSQLLERWADLLFLLLILWSWNKMLSMRMKFKLEIPVMRGVLRGV